MSSHQFSLAHLGALDRAAEVACALQSRRAARAANAAAEVVRSAAAQAAQLTAAAADVEPDQCDVRMSIESSLSPPDGADDSMNNALEQEGGPLSRLSFSQTSIGGDVAAEGDAIAGGGAPSFQLRDWMCGRDDTDYVNEEAMCGDVFVRVRCLFFCSMCERDVKRIAKSSLFDCENAQSRGYGPLLAGGSTQVPRRGRRRIGVAPVATARGIWGFWCGLPDRSVLRLQ